MHHRLTNHYLTLLLTCLLTLTITHCECNNSPSTSEQPDKTSKYTGSWVEGKMKVVGSQLKLAIQQFKDNTAGLTANKNTLFQLVTKDFTIDQIDDDGKDMQYGKFSMSEAAKKKALEEVVLDDTDIDKILTIIPNKPMGHKASSENTKVLTTNFGDRSVFFGYASNLFAQDEVQIAEMPHLAMLKHTHDQELHTKQNEAFLCTNVPRYVDLDTSGIYGKLSAFDESNLQAILPAKLKYRNPITHNHIVSIAAPTDLSAGQSYQLTNFSKFFLPAFCAYQAARQVFPNNKIQIETGNWGAGAFGNDIRIAAISQILAAALSKVQLDIYPFGKIGEQQWKEGIQLLKDGIVDLQKTRTALTASNIFNRTQEIATRAGRPLQKGKGNGT